jgi:hypothetical protein
MIKDDRERLKKERTVPPKTQYRLATRLEACHRQSVQGKRIRVWQAITLPKPES